MKTIEQIKKNPNVVVLVIIRDYVAPCREEELTLPKIYKGSIYSLTDEKLHIIITEYVLAEAERDNAEAHPDFSGEYCITMLVTPLELAMDKP